MSADDRVRYWRDRARGAEQEAAFYKAEHDHLLAWFTERITRERELEARCTFLYGKCRLAGISDTELAGGTVA